MGESDQRAKEMAYGQLPGFGCGVDMEQTRIALSKDYVRQAGAVVETQLAKAGYRLASLLNRAWGTEAGKGPLIFLYSLLNL